MGNKAGLYEETSRSGGLEAVLIQYAQLVKQIAYHLLARLPPSVQVEDLIQAGMIGLIEAHQRFDSSKNVTFETYASIRVRGMMLDELRRMSWMPRSTHQNMRSISQAIHNVENRTGHEAQPHEISKELGISPEEYAEMLASSYANELFSLHEVDEGSILEGSEKSEPEHEAQKAELHKTLTKALSTLPPQEQIVLAFYYSEKLKFKEIGEVLGVGEARVCQLHGQALARLSARVKNE